MPIVLTSTSNNKKITVHIEIDYVEKQKTTAYLISGLTLFEWLQCSRYSCLAINGFIQPRTMHETNLLCSH